MLQQQNICYNFWKILLQIVVTQNPQRLETKEQGYLSINTANIPCSLFFIHHSTALSSVRKVRRYWLTQGDSSVFYFYATFKIIALLFTHRTVPLCLSAIHNSSFIIHNYFALNSCNCPSLIV